MTVAELIERLSGLDQSAICVLQMPDAPYEVTEVYAFAGKVTPSENGVYAQLVETDETNEEAAFAVVIS